jgi:hypothetical protein
VLCNAHDPEPVNCATRLAKGREALITSHRSGNSVASPRDTVEVVEAYSLAVDSKSTFWVMQYPKLSPSRPRPTLGSALALIEKEAFQLRETIRVPYWHALMLLAERDEVAIPEPVIEAVGYHEDHTIHAREPMSADDVRSGSLRRRLAMVPRDAALAILSTVDMPDGTNLHIPMIDFRIEPSESARITARRVCSYMKLSGFLANSGNSYHFYGRELVDAEQHRTHLRRGLLFAPITDQRWLAHELINGESALRISGQPQLPLVIEFVQAT